MAWPVLEYLALFLIVLIHEFGHTLACRQVGGQANQIVLWPLGGVAYVDARGPRPGPGAAAGRPQHPLEITSPNIASVPTPPPVAPTLPGMPAHPPVLFPSRRSRGSLLGPPWKRGHTSAYIW